MAAVRNFAARPTYTSAQLARYFDHVRLPSAHRSIDPRNLSHLYRLQRYQLATVPWENLSKHYNKSVTPVTALLGHNDLFDKIVGSGRGREDGAGGGRGGGCLENNAFFGHVLRSLGFEVYPGGGRVNMGGGAYTGWEHMVNFITIDKHKYISDVGFGAKGQVHPLLLHEEHESPNVAPARARLVKARLPGHTDPSQRIWVYQMRNDTSAESDWEDIYAFTETEFLPQDFEAMTVGTTFRRNSFFAYSIAMCRMVMASEVAATHGTAAPANQEVGGSEQAEAGSDEIVGVITMTERECKRRVRGATEVLGTFEKEDQRADALKRWFGIEFSEGERRGVAGTVVGLAD